MVSIKEDLSVLMSRRLEGTFQFRQLLSDITADDYVDELVHDINELVLDTGFAGHGLVISIDKLINNGFGNILVLSKKGFFIGVVPYFIFTPSNGQEVLVSVRASVSRKVRTVVELQAVLLEPFFRAFLSGADKDNVHDTMNKLVNIKQPITLEYCNGNITFSITNTNGESELVHNLLIY